MNDEEKMLTTIDNPYSPFDQFKQWHNYDTTVKKHGTCSYLARVFNVVKDKNPEMTDEEATEEAIKIIISNDFDKKYKLVTNHTHS